mgnify:CR=1 FL=1
MYQSTSYSNELTFFQKLRAIDYTLLISILTIGIISCFTMYSTDGGEILYHTRSHIIRFVIFFSLMLFISFINIRFWYSTAYLFYVFVLGLLIWASFYGITVSGSQRWIDLYFLNLQPSELMKVGLILFLAKYYHRISSSDVNKIKFLIRPIIALIIPVILVITQPDLGTAFLIAISGAVVVWLAGVKMKFFAYLSVIFLDVAPIAISFLKPYQKSRILTFIDPSRDPLGAGYQITQSKIAIGSGGLFGKGFLNGSQSYLDYLPEKHTDFIFTLFSEEYGFIGSVFLLLLYVIMIYRIYLIGANSRSFFAKLFCYGYSASIFIYVTVNMSMVLGLLPIVGSPLPIMSYGGSSMMAIMFGLGIAMSCRVYKDTPVN